MSKRISERQRWVEVFRVGRPAAESRVDGIIERHEEALAVLTAFARIGRVVRAERDPYGGIILKARRS